MEWFVITTIAASMTLFLAWKTSTLANKAIKFFWISMVFLGLASMAGVGGLSVSVFAQFVTSFLFGFALVWDKSDKKNICAKIAMGLLSVWGAIVSIVPSL